MAQWSLRTKLVAVLATALLPVVVLSGVDAYRDATAKKARHVESVLASAEIAASGHRQLLEGSRRLLISACSDDAVSASAVPTPVPEDVERCDAYLTRVAQNFPTDYSALLVTDAAGQVRCASLSSAIDKNLGDRQVFKAVRDTKKLSIGLDHRQPRHAQFHHSARAPGHGRRPVSRHVRPRPFDKGVRSRLGVVRECRAGRQHRHSLGRTERDDPCASHCQPALQGDLGCRAGLYRLRPERPAIRIPHPAAGRERPLHRCRRADPGWAGSSCCSKTGAASR